ncbi:MAG: DNA integrity scanning protein DisA nucleotide-binding domain protein [Cytophagaceae bacterium]
MSLSQKKHGTSLIFYDINKRNEKKLVKAVKITLEEDVFLDKNNLSNDIPLLDSLVSPDGAVFFNQQLMPTHISSILPIGQTAIGISGGARHNSIANFTKEFKCLGIVVSEDGPISIFKNGEKLIKF